MVTSKASKVSIRRAVSSDIPQVADLVRQVSDHNHDYSVEVIRAIFSDLVPGEYYGWLAFAGDQPVGITTLQPCLLELGGRPCKAGYWTYLCVRPDYRRTALYPRLVYAMIGGAADVGIDVVYGAIRRPQVAAGHLALGMEKIGEMPVLAKPLRPARLLSKFYGLGHVFAQVSAVPDYAYQEYLSLRRSSPKPGYIVRNAAARDADPSVLVPVLRELHVSEMQRPMTPESFAHRYATSPDGDEYRVLCVEGLGEIRAAIIYRMAVRSKNIHTLVIMEMGHRFSDLDSLAFGLAELERRAIQSKCEVILALSSSPFMQTLLKKSGYLRSNETYVLMKKPTSRKADCAFPDRIDDWYFTFADHNAF